MKKKVVIGICILLIALLFVPIRGVYKDGGTVVYNAVAYRVEKVHQLAPLESEQEFLEGTIVEILGIEVFNNVK